MLIMVRPPPPSPPVVVTLPTSLPLVCLVLLIGQALTLVLHLLVTSLLLLLDLLPWWYSEWECGRLDWLPQDLSSRSLVSITPIRWRHTLWNCSSNSPPLARSLCVGPGSLHVGTSTTDMKVLMVTIPVVIFSTLARTVLASGDIAFFYWRCCTFRQV